MSARACGRLLVVLVALPWPVTRGVAQVLVPTQRIENANLDSGLRAWSIYAGIGHTSEVWSSLSNGSTPGSLRLFNSHGGPGLGASSAAGQCVPDIVAGATYGAEAYWYAPGGQPLNPGGGFVALDLDFHADKECADLGFSHSYPFTAFGSGGNGGWQLTTAAGVLAPPGARSVSVVLINGKWSDQPIGSSYINFDEVRLFGPSAFTKGSFYNRGETDLLLRNLVTGEHRVWFMNDERRSAETAITPAVPVEWEAAGVDDFGGDNRNDLLLWRPATGWVDFWMLNGTARSGSAVPITPVDPGPSWKPSATADFNHDGQPDIVMRNLVSQEIVIWRMDGTNHLTNITPSPSHAVDANWEIVGGSDLNGDGNADLLWYNASSGRIVYWLMNASVVRTTGAFTNPVAAGDNNWKVVALGDYGLGNTAVGQPGAQDLVWRNATSGRLVVWYMDRAGNRQSGLFAVPPDLPAPAGNWTVVGPR